MPGPALTPAEIRAFDVYVNTEIMAGRKRTVTNWEAIAKKTSPGNAVGIYGWNNSLPNILRKQASGYQRAGMSSNALTLTSDEVGLFIEIKARDVRDSNRSGMYQNIPGDLGQRMEQFPQRNLFRLFKEGDQSSFEGRSILAYDGLSFFNDNHLVNGRDSSDGTYDNNLTGTALTQTNLGVARAVLETMPDDRGESRNQRATHLIVPPQLSDAGAAILMADAITTGVFNPTSNQTLAARGKSKIELIEAPELAGDPTAWYLVSVEEGGAPMIWQETVALYIVSLIDPKDPNMVNDDTLVWAAKGESGFGFADPKRAIRCIA
jgi:phage major head subunit gpT-like protein